MNVNCADQPTAADGEREYHLHTKPGDIAPYCLLVGSPERAEMIADQYFASPRLVGDHRGLKSFTGTCRSGRSLPPTMNDVPISVVTTGMGAPSLGIVLPEAYRCGARMFIRVGSCSALRAEAKPGDVVIVTGAMRLEGASRSWAPIEYPAFADHQIVAALIRSSWRVRSSSTLIGVEATTDDFNEGQGRPNLDGVLLAESEARHKRILELNVACYSMEASALFVWCATHGGGIPAGAINAVYGNRITNEFRVAGDELAARFAVEAIEELSTPPRL